MLGYKKYISEIKPVDTESEKMARKRFDMLAKPPGSLGGLEDISAKLSSVTGEIFNTLEKRQILVFASDNGVYEEGVASAPQSVTLAQSINMLKGITGVCVLAKQAKSSVTVIDVGINSEYRNPKLIDRKIRKSTSNIANGSAMSYEEAQRAVEIGIEAVKTAYENGCDLLGVGEMGIGNTTTSSAVLASLLGLKGCEVENLVGKGAGLTHEAFKKKIDVIKNSIEINKPQKDNPIDVLSKVGGFDIAAMCGAYIGAAYYRIPVVIDGFISIVAALCAARLNPLTADYMFASHYSFERGYKLALDELKLKAYLHLNMRLGEGSGCPLMFQLMDSACAMMRNMATFDEALIDTEYLNSISKSDF